MFGKMYFLLLLVVLILVLVFSILYLVFSIIIILSLVWDVEKCMGGQVTKVSWL